MPYKSRIEKHLKERLGSLFDLEYDLLLYDVTSTYFEGACEGNGLAKRGYSRDSRPDCLQVCIGLVVTTDGIPLGYEVFAGNRHDSTTVEETRTKDGLYNGTVRLRCVTEPDEAQKVLLHRLGIPLPRRLRRIDEFAQM